VLCPEQVPLLQEARKKQRSIIGSNFVDRESERPTITLNDFLPLLALAPKSDVGSSNIRKKRKSRYCPLISLSFCLCFSTSYTCDARIVRIIVDRILPLLQRFIREEIREMGIS